MGPKVDLDAATPICGGVLVRSLTPRLRYFQSQFHQASAQGSKIVPIRFQSSKIALDAPTMHTGDGTEAVLFSRYRWSWVIRPNLTCSALTRVIFAMRPLKTTSCSYSQDLLLPQAEVWRSEKASGSMLLFRCIHLAPLVEWPGTSARMGISSQHIYMYIYPG